MFHSRAGRLRNMTRVFLCCIFVTSVLAGHTKPPNIILIIADDLGWNDVGFHGLNNIPTPNIDALAASGLILHNHYVAPICTPSRAALVTGKYPIHTGMQHGVLYGQDTRGLPLSEKILPQYLKDLGYMTHLVGKWHLGSYKKEYLPLNRGFDSHFGFWTGKIDMYDHTNAEKGTWGFDFRTGFNVADDLFGKYVTDLYADEAIKIIKSHNKTQPLFLMLAHSAVHSGNPDEPIRAPDKVIDLFQFISDYYRRKFAAVLWKLDRSIGKVVAALEAEKLLENSVILFTTDNGGVPAGFNDNAGSNYPLRGTKNTVWEGGVRGASLLWSPFIEKRARIAKQKIHLVDWLPTLLSVAGGDLGVLKNIDGVDQWETLSKDLHSKRSVIVHNIDDIEHVSSIFVDNWKIIKGTTYDGKWDGWYGPAGNETKYDMDMVYESLAGKAIDKLGLMPARNIYENNRLLATINCASNSTPIECNPLVAPCLFNIDEDPCERRNLANLNPGMVASLLHILVKFNTTVVPPNNEPIDPKGDPKYWNRIFTNFGDYNETDIQNNECTK